MLTELGGHGGGDEGEGAVDEAAEGEGEGGAAGETGAGSKARPSAVLQRTGTAVVKINIIGLQIN